MILPIIINMKNVLLVMGGNSFEKDISIITANQVLNNIDISKYNVFSVLLDNGLTYINNPKNLSSFLSEKESKNHRAIIMDKKLYEVKKNRLIEKCNIDCALLCTHGGNGENGAIQGLLEIENIPHTSLNLKGSCICMYKSLTKCFLKKLGINQLKAISLKYNEPVEELCNQLDYPVIIKPNSLGSSIGINVVNNKDEFLNAIKEAFLLDDELIIEKALSNFRELNIACYKKDNEIILSEIEETKGMEKIYSFEEKYIDNDSKITKIIPANIPDVIAKKIRTNTEKIYNKLSGKGIVRFDYLLKDNKLYLNEINTIPGSLAFYLFKGISFTDLISEQIEESILIFNKQKRDYVYKTNVIENYLLKKCGKKTKLKV